MRNALISLALLSAVASAPLIAQDKTIDVRVNKLEKEMKAVQRKVFPSGVPVQPEIVPPAAVAATAAPAANPPAAPGSAPAPAPSHKHKRHGKKHHR